MTRLATHEVCALTGRHPRDIERATLGLMYAPPRPPERDAPPPLPRALPDSIKNRAFMLAKVLPSFIGDHLIAACASRYEVEGLTYLRVATQLTDWVEVRALYRDALRGER